jgi:hypothetical protein
MKAACASNGLLLALAAAVGPGVALDNGVGRLPVMGWTSWIISGQGDLWTGSPLNVTGSGLLTQGTPSRTPWTLSIYGKCCRKRARTSGGTFGSTARATASCALSHHPR